MSNPLVCFAAALGLSICATAFVASCGGPIPAIPSVSADGFQSEVREAIASAQSQAQASPSDGQASGHYGMVLQAHSLYQPAAICYRRAIRLQPDEFAWRYDLALTLQQLSMLDDALDAISAALRIRSDYAPAILKRGELLFQLGNFRESGRAYEDLLARDQGSVAALYGLARVRYAQKDFAASKDLYQRACQAFSGFGAAYYGLAVANRSLGLEADAAKDFDLAKQYDGQAPPSPDPVLADVFNLAKGSFNQVQQASELMAQGKNPEAARLYLDVLSRDPDNLSALISVLYLARFVDFGNQIDDFHSRAVRINPNIAVVENHYGAALLRQGRVDVATTALQRALELNPGNAEAHLWLGQAREMQHRNSEALDQYARALSMQPSLYMAKFQLARLLADQGRNREAIPYLRALLQDLTPDDTLMSPAMVLLGEAYGDTGQREEAREYLEQAHARVRKEGPPQLLAEIEDELRKLPPR